MTDSFIFTGTGFVTGKYKVTNDEIYENINKGFLGGFNEERIIASDSYKLAKQENKELNPFNFMVHNKMGFKNRYHVVPFPPSAPLYKKAEKTIDITVKSVSKALEDAGISGNQVDAWFVSTATSDSFAPGIAEFTKAYFTDSNNNTPTYSLTSACVGFNINIQNALAFLKNNKDAKHVVIAHGEIMSKLLINKHDFVPFSTFGDSAAAVVLSKVKSETQCGIIDVENGEDVAMLDFLGANIKGDLYMDARRVKMRAVPNIANTFKSLLNKFKCTIDEIDWFIPHQTGNAIVHSVKDILDIPDNKLFQEVQYEYGNLSGASVPACIDILRKSGRLKPKQKIATAVAGLGGEFGGFTYIVPDEKYRFEKQKDLINQSILITGATGAIGTEIAEHAAKQGANLILQYNSNDVKANKTKEYLISKYQIKVELWKADLSSEKQILDYSNKINENKTKIDYLIVTHAITGSLSKASKVSDDEFMTVMTANYNSISNLCNSMIDNINKGVLITGSVGEDAQFSGSVAYVSSKRALRGYAVNLASRLYDKRIACIYYLPGLVDGGMISKLDKQQVAASMMSIEQEKLIDKNEIALRMLNSIYRLKIPNVRMSYESKLKVIKDGYLKF